VRLAPSRIAGFLQRPDPEIRSVLLYGPDEGLVRERADAVARSVCPDLRDPFRVADLTAGVLAADPARLAALTPVEAADFRNREIGYVWQFHYLLPEFTAAENVAIPLLARGKSKKEALQEAIHWLGEVGLADRSTHRAGELSGGEQQRVSIARALITRPKLLLADEPTGDLDNQTAEALFSLLESLHASYGLTSILVTHNMPLARRCDRVLRLAHGRVEEVSSLEV